jgi:hypothetical protein
VKSFRSDKRQLDAELRKAIDRLKTDTDRTELFGFDDRNTVDQVFEFSLPKICQLHVNRF